MGRSFRKRDLTSRASASQVNDGGSLALAAAGRSLVIAVLGVFLPRRPTLNIALYERHGFGKVGTIQVGSSPSIFPMLRHAR